MEDSPNWVNSPVLFHADGARSDDSGGEKFILISQVRAILARDVGGDTGYYSFDD